MPPMNERRSRWYSSQLRKKIYPPLGAGCLSFASQLAISFLDRDAGDLLINFATSRNNSICSSISVSFVLARYTCIYIRSQPVRIRIRRDVSLRDMSHIFRTTLWTKRFSFVLSMLTIAYRFVRKTERRRNRTKWIKRNENTFQVQRRRCHGI